MSTDDGDFFDPLHSLLRDLTLQQGIGVFYDIYIELQHYYQPLLKTGLLGGYAHYTQAHETTSSLVHAYICDEILRIPCVLNVEVGRHSMMFESQQPEDFVSSLGLSYLTQDDLLMKRAHKVYLGDRSNLKDEDRLPEWISDREQEQFSSLFEFWKQARHDWLHLDETYSGFNQRIEKPYVMEDPTFMVLWRDDNKDIYDLIFRREMDFSTPCEPVASQRLQGYFRSYKSIFPPCFSLTQKLNFHLMDMEHDFFDQENFSDYVVEHEEYPFSSEQNIQSFGQVKKVKIKKR